MNLEFRLRPHAIREQAQVIEVWSAGQFIGQITGLFDEQGYPMLRVMSKHPLSMEAEPEGDDHILSMRVTIKPQQ